MRRDDIRRISRVRSLVLVALALMLVLPWAAGASSVDVSVVDVTAPTGSVTLSPGASAPITIRMTVTGKQDGTATFKVNRDWTLSGGTFTGTNPITFTVYPRAAQDPANVFTTDGTVTVASDQQAGTFVLAVAVFDITNDNQTGGKLSAGSSSYQVIVEAPPTPADTEPPVITCPEDITAEATSPDGAVVDFDVTATDNVEVASLVANPPSGSTFPITTTTVTATATDTSGNSATCQFKVTVRDTTPPKITCPGDITVYATGASQAVVTYTATAYDLVSGYVPVVFSHESGSSFPVGTTTVTATAKDGAGNTSSCTFKVTVLYNWSGFFAPVDNLPVWNRVKAGSAVPVKFRLGGDQGLSVFAAGYPRSVAIQCGTATLLDDIEQTVTAGQSSLTYDPIADQYVYVWKTDKAWAGTCRQLVVRLADGTEHVANFTFTK